MIRDNYLDISKIVKDKKIFRLFRAVEAHGGVLRFVGGSVRNALKGIEASDIDLATDLAPDELVEACQEKGLRTVPIGIKFGTVGVVIENCIYEVTSLRKDIKTDGRHAVVEFTTDWEEDASRRDLTINAVYADEKGNVFDYYNGIEDMEKGIVRFIGNPNHRIKEDFLRILRFFRFYSIFGEGEIDAKALKACAENKDGIKNLSMERICDELKKIMVTPHVVKTLNIMFDYDILGSFLPRSENLDKLANLIRITDKLNVENKVLRRLFMLYLPGEELAENLANRFKLTKKQKEAFILLAKANPKIKEFLDDKSLLKLVYKYGKDFCRDKLLIQLAVEYKGLENLKAVLEKIESIVVPIFPLRGKDLVPVVSNPHHIGVLIEKLEETWIESNFEITREELLALAQSMSVAV